MANLLRGTILVEVDFSAIEAVLVGWFARSPSYIRLAKVGVHSGLASHILGKPYPLDATDAQLKQYLSAIKEEAQATKSGSSDLYDVSKRVVHGCLAPDHQVLTPTGWVRFDEYLDDTPVAQWDPHTNAVSFVVPQAVTRMPFQGTHLTELWGRSLSAQMTPDHRLPFKFRSTGEWGECTAATLPSQGQVPSSGVLEGDESVDPDLLRLVVAVQADAAVGSGQLVFHFHRPRKTARLIEILTALGMPYTCVPCACHPQGHRFRVATAEADQVLAWLEGPEKRFHLPLFLRLTATCRQVVLDELPYWDGSRTDKGSRYYFTMDPVQAERVQTLAISLGRQALLRDRPIRTGSFSTDRPLYAVSFNRRASVSVESLTRREIPYAGLVYCVTVPTGFFLVRHRNRVSVTGNSAYCLTPHGMVNNFPKQFKTIAQAKKYQDIYFKMAPDVPDWQRAVQRFAYDHGYLGGPGDPPFGHPFGYKHYFYAVASYRKISEKGYTKRQEQGYAVARFNGLPYAVDMGEDAKRAVAFFPQSTGRGILTESMLRLFDPEEAEPYQSYIGDAYYGRTPLRAPIHDSFFLEIPRFLEDRIVPLVYQEMVRPVVQMPNPASWGLGPYLSVDVEVKRGLSWDAMTKVKDLKVEVEPYAPSLDEELEDVEALQTEVA